MIVYDRTGCKTSTKCFEVCGGGAVGCWKHWRQTHVRKAEVRSLVLKWLASEASSALHVTTAIKEMFRNWKGLFREAYKQ
jgi:hypothetical protein